MFYTNIQSKNINVQPIIREYVFDLYLQHMLTLHILYHLTMTTCKWFYYWLHLKHQLYCLSWFSASTCCKYVVLFFTLFIKIVNGAYGAYNQNVLTFNYKIPYQSSVGKSKHVTFPLEIEANVAQLQPVHASLPSRSHHGFMNGSSDVEVHIKAKFGITSRWCFEIICLVYLLYMALFLLCHGDILYKLSKPEHLRAVSRPYPYPFHASLFSKTSPSQNANVHS